jgi:hypothetical protein
MTTAQASAQATPATTLPATPSTTLPATPSTALPAGSPAPATGPVGATATPPTPAPVADPSVLVVGAPVAPTGTAVISATPPAPTQDTKVVPVEYTPTGDVALDASLAFLGRHGYGPEHPAVKAASEGNFGLLKAEMAAKNIPGAAEYLTLGEDAYKANAAKQAARRVADTAAVMEIVGGEKNWNDIRKWAAGAAEPGELAEVNAGLAAGGLTAKATAAYLAGLYAKAAGTTVQPAGVVKPNTGTNVPSTGALSPEQYKNEVQNLVSKLGTTELDSHPEYMALTARRRAFRG